MQNQDGGRAPSAVQDRRLRASSFIGACASLVLLSVLTGCVQVIPETIFLRVYNDRTDGLHKTCEGGLGGSFAVGSLSLQSPKVAPADNFEVSQRTPADAPSGTQAVAEATCYDAQGAEIGYSRVVKNWHGGNDQSVVVLAPLVDPSRASEGCLPTAEVRGDAPCIMSALLQ